MNALAWQTHACIHTCIHAWSRLDRRVWAPLLCVLCLESVEILDESRYLMTDWRHDDTGYIMPCVASYDRMIYAIGFRDHIEVLMSDVIT